jgi:hypothetical protein
MSEPENAESVDRAGRPGKIRTWWHPLLARLLDHVLASAYTVQDEVLVGKMPLRIDLLLIRREAGLLSEASRRDLSALVPLLNYWTLIEFKGPTDALEPGDVAQLLGCAFLWHSQQTERLPLADISLIVLAPNTNQALRDELQSLGCQAREQEAGISRVMGLPFTTWLVETDVMAQRGQPILSLVSRVFLGEPRRIIEQLTATGYTSLITYVLQQIAQFRRLGEDFAMQHKDAEYLGELEEELQTAVLKVIPVEKRLQGLSEEELQTAVLKMIPVEKRLQGLSAEEILSRFTPEEILSRFTPEEILSRYTPEQLAKALSAEQIARLRELSEPKRQQ